jgi:hypothetical protein
MNDEFRMKNDECKRFNYSRDVDSKIDVIRIVRHSLARLI